MTTSRTFVDELSSAAFSNVFNPYRDTCGVYDVENAPEIRRSNLLSMLMVAEERGIESIWVGRDLGYRGGRRTGLALTDDVRLQAHAKRWGLEFARPTIGPAVAERTATVVWNLLDHIPHSIFMWNVFPLHPHEENDGFSNRQHSRAERRFGLSVLEDLIKLLVPKKIICIGNDAASAVNEVNSNSNVILVRHPSYGGQTIFVAQMSDLYGITKPEGHPSLF